MAATTAAIGTCGIIVFFNLLFEEKNSMRFETPYLEEYTPAQH